MKAVTLEERFGAVQIRFVYIMCNSDMKKNVSCMFITRYYVFFKLARCVKQYSGWISRLDALKKCFAQLWEMYELEKLGRFTDACDAVEKNYMPSVRKRS